MVKEYETKFGLDKPLWQQYLTYMSATCRAATSTISIANYPRKVIDMIGEALPWTIALLLMTTILGVPHRQPARARSWPGRRRRSS